MKPWAMYGAGALAGAALFFAAQFAVNNRTGHVVHAQTYEPGCVASVPKSWGSFRGVSDGGVAFEDQAGTVRVIAHPMCGNNLSNEPAIRADLEIRRP